MNTTILSIDNGTNYLGVAISSYSIVDDHLLVEYANTLNCADYPSRFNLRAYHSEKEAKIDYIKSYIKELMFMDDFVIDEVVIENCFCYKSPLAFAYLSECIAGIKDAIFDIDPLMNVTMIAPKRAKLSVGADVTVKGAKAKQEVRRAIFSNDKISFSSQINREKLGADAIDAVAVGFALAEKLSVLYLKRVLYETKRGINSPSRLHYW